MSDVPMTTESTPEPPKAKKAPKEVDHDKSINAALDAARDAMVASGMSESDANAYLNSARPSGTSTAVGNLADLMASSGLPTVTVDSPPTINEDRLTFAHKIDKEAPDPPLPTKTF